MLALESNALFWMKAIVSGAVILQTIEILQIGKAYDSNGIWKWSVIRREFEIFPRAIRWVLDLLLDYPNFNLLLFGRIYVATLLLIPEAHSFHSILLALLFLSTVLICLRWRGTFNGGSDYMTLIVLMGLGIATSFEEYPKVVTGCLWYVAIQTCLSYFVAGVIKLRSGNWRSGRALAKFIGSSNYGVPPLVQRIAKNQPALCLLGSWAVILFECSFPLALLSPQYSQVFLGVAVFFHLANVYVFGLNRFLFAWAAAYPALIFCSAQW